MKPQLSEIEAILKVSGIASASLLPEEAKGRVCHSVAIDIVAYYEPLIEQANDALEAARAAILDAIYCEDGLDGHTGSVVMEWITDILQDEKEYRPTIEGVTSQTEIAEDKAFVHRDELIRQAKAEVAREILEVYDRYIKLLGEEIDTLSPLAIAHGWRSVRFEAGNKCRADIQAVQSKYTGGKK